MTLLIDFRKDRRGASAVEYGLLIGLIVIGLIAGASEFGSSLGGILGTVAEKL